MAERGAKATDDAIAQWRESHRIPGLAVGVVMDGGLVHASFIGSREDGQPIDGNTAFRIGSISKVFAATVAALLAEEGHVDLNAPAVRYLEELGNVVYPSPDAPYLTLRHLLTHTAGLPNTDAFEYGDPTLVVDEQLVLRPLAGLVLDRAPGERWAYSSWGFNVASLALGRAVKTPYETLVRQRLLAPLHMTRTVWSERDVPPGQLAPGHRRGLEPIRREQHWRLGAGQAAGGLYSTLHDLGKWASFQLATYPAGIAGSAAAPPAIIRDTHRSGPAVEFYGRFEDDELTAASVAQGLGWVVRTDCRFETVVFHNGALEGYWGSLYLLPHYGIGVVALTNSRVPTAGLASRVLRAFVDEGGFSPRIERPDPELVRLTEESLELARAWSDAAYARLYSKTFRSIVSAAQWRAEMEKLRDRGRCRYVRPLKVTSPRDARFLFACETGSISVGVELSTGNASFTRYSFSPHEGDRPTRCRVVTEGG
ncbi:MAG: serine hydrolase domain-containing protein [Myxococcota bacterium]